MSFKQWIETDPKLLNDKGRPLDLTTPLFHKVADALERSSRVVLCASRRQGKSSVVAALCLHALSQPFGEILYVAGTAVQAASIVGAKLLKILPFARQRDLFQVSLDGVRVPSFGSSLRVIPAHPDYAPGRSPTLLVVDEMRSVDPEGLEVLLASCEQATVVFTGSPGAPGTAWHRLVTEPPPGYEVIWLQSPTEGGNPELPAAFVEAEVARLRSQGKLGECLAEREWGGRFVAIAECPLVGFEDVERAAVDKIEAFRLNREEVFVGVDIGLTHDLATVATIASRGGRHRVLELDVYDPRHYVGGVPLELIEKRLLALYRRYVNPSIVVDAYQAVGLVQRLRCVGVRVTALAITGAINQQGFELLASALREGAVTWSRTMAAAERLRSELLNLEVEESASGFRVVDRDKRWHRDACFSLMLAVREASQSSSALYAGGDFERLHRDPEEEDDDALRKKGYALGTDWLGPVRRYERRETNEEYLFRRCREAMAIQEETERRLCRKP